MSKNMYTEFSRNDEPLLAKDELLEVGIAELQHNLDKILDNQNEILARLCQVAHNRPTTELFKVNQDFFSVTDPEELSNLDANLSKPNNKYIGLKRPEGRVEPLKMFSWRTTTMV